MPLSTDQIKEIASRAAKSVIKGTQPSTLEEFHRLSQELRELREKRAQLTEALTEHQRKEDLALIDFKKKNPNAKFPGSPEWESLVDESKKIARPLVEVTDRMASVKKQMDILSPDAEEDEEEELENLNEDEDQEEELSAKECPLGSPKKPEGMEPEEECHCDDLKPMAEWILEEDDDGDLCHECILKPIVEYYISALNDAKDEPRVKLLKEAWGSEDLLTIGEVMDRIKLEVGESLKKRLLTFDCYAQTYKPEAAADDEQHD